MKKNEHTLRKRQTFVNLAICDNEKAAEYLQHAAMSLSQCQNTMQIIAILENLLFLSERTIMYDITKSLQNTANTAK